MAFESNYLSDQNDEFPKFYYPHNTGPVLSECTRQCCGVALANLK